MAAVVKPPSHVLRLDRPLRALFAPRAVAVIGATEKPGSVGRTVLTNLIGRPVRRAVFPVNAHRADVLGIKAYPSIGAVPGQVDLAVIVTPAATVPGHHPRVRRRARDRRDRHLGGLQGNRRVAGAALERAGAGRGPPRSHARSSAPTASA